VERFGRGVDASIDAILIIVEPSYESMAIARRIKEIAAGMGKSIWAVLNKVKSNGMTAKLKTEMEKSNVDVIGVVSDDPVVLEASFEGRPFESKTAAHAAKKILNFLTTDMTVPGKAVPAH